MTLSLRRFGWGHPEWWTLALSAVAWVSLLSDEPVVGGHRQHHYYHQASILNGSMLLRELWLWVLMIMAMMLPVLVTPVRVVAARSLWRRRHRAIASFLVGYLATWLVVGAVACSFVLVSGVRQSAYVQEVGFLCFVLAAIWQISAAKKRAARACDSSRPLAPRGWRADRDCAGFGFNVGRGCITSCWALMLLCLLTAHSFPMMIGGAVLALGERYTRWLDARLAPAAVLALAGVYAVCVMV